MRAYINEEKLEKYLDGRSLSWLVNKINDMDIPLSYNAFQHILKNRNECRLTYAFAISEILKIDLREIFYLK